MRLAGRGSTIVFEWRCENPECGGRHTWSGRCADVVAGLSGCPFCCVKGRRFCTEPACVICFEKSVAGQAVALAHRQMSCAADADRQRTTPPLSAVVLEWLCLSPDCGHAWEASCADVCRTIKPSGCPYCCSRNAIVCEDHACEPCRRNSVLGSLVGRRLELAAGPAAARKLIAGSAQRCTWRCTNPECGHTWEAPPAHVCGPSTRLSSRSGSGIAKGGSGCPFCCTNGAIICVDAVCDPCTRNSVLAWACDLFIRDIKFAAGDVVARATAANAGDRCDWQCLANKDHPNWSARCKYVIGRHTGCPMCKNKTESMVYLFLAAEYGAEAVTPQERVPAIDAVRLLDFTVRLPDARPVVVEVDGGQHFRDIPTFKSVSAEQIANDTLKARGVIAAGWALVRISQEDVWSGHFQWNGPLRVAIHELSRSSSAAMSVRFLAADPSLYDRHKATLAAAQAATPAGGAAPAAAAASASGGGVSAAGAAAGWWARSSAASGPSAAAVAAFPPDRPPAAAARAANLGPGGLLAEVFGDDAPRAAGPGSSAFYPDSSLGGAGAGAAAFRAQQQGHVPRRPAPGAWGQQSGSAAQGAGTPLRADDPLWTPAPAAALSAATLPLSRLAASGAPPSSGTTLGRLTPMSAAADAAGGAAQAPRLAASGRAVATPAAPASVAAPATATPALSSGKGPQQQQQRVPAAAGSGAQAKKDEKKRKAHQAANQQAHNVQCFAGFFPGKSAVASTLSLPAAAAAVAAAAVAAAALPAGYGDATAADIVPGDTAAAAIVPEAGGAAAAAAAAAAVPADCELAMPSPAPGAAAALPTPVSLRSPLLWVARGLFSPGESMRQTGRCVAVLTLLHPSCRYVCDEPRCR